MKISKDDLLQYVLDDEQLSEEVVRYIEMKRKDPNSSISAWFSDFLRRLNANGNDISWTEIMNEEDSPTPNASYQEEINRYQDFDDRQLEQELIRCLPPEDLELVMRSGNDFLLPYKQRLKEALCPAWTDLRNKYADAATGEIVKAIVDSMVVCSIQIPFPFALIGTYLVRQGLDTFCEQSEQDENG